MAEPYSFDVFLSHSSKDKPLVREIAERLSRDGIHVWFDEWEIKPGDNIMQKIEEGLMRSRVLVLCMSRDAMASDWAQLEAGTFRFRDPLNKARRFIPLRLDDSDILESLRQVAYIDWRKRSDDQYLELRSACTFASNQEAEPSNVPVGIAPLWDLLEKSFAYCLDRKVNPSQSSNTSMHFYGINFNASKPTILATAGIQAIGTELEHLDQVIWGEPHNPSKLDRKSQIADEFVDMMRDLFILAIANGFDHWDEIDWARQIESAYQSAEQDLSVHIAELNTLYQQLVGYSHDGTLQRSLLRKWISNQIRAMTGVARSCNITLDELASDLNSRLHEDKSAPDATVKNSSHPYLTKGVFIIYRATIPDFPGTYRHLLRRIHECGFDIWASASRTIIYGEEAEAAVVMATGGDESPSDDDVDEQIRQLCESPLGRAMGKFKPNRLVISYRELIRRRIDAASEGQFYEYVSTGLTEFWKTQLESISHLGVQ